MIKVGHKKITCPRCGEEYFVNYHDVDSVHKCLNNDGTRKTSRNWDDHPEGGLTKTDDFRNLGLDPLDVVPWSEQKKRMRHDNEVNCYIDLE